jgi:RND superfamily putative drug exporter
VFAVLVRLATTHPKRVVATVAALSLVAVAGGSGVADRLAPYAADDPRTESVRADALLERSGAGAGVDVVALVQTPRGATSATGRGRVDRVARRLRADPDVRRVVTFEHGGRSLIARDARSTYVAAGFRPGTDDIEAGKRLAARLGEEPGVRLGGSAIARAQVNDQTASDLRRAELLVFPLLFVLSFLFFRSVVAALLPLLVGGVSIVLTMLGLRLGSEPSAPSPRRRSCSSRNSASGRRWPCSSTRRSSARCWCRP